MTPEEQIIANLDWRAALTGNIFTAVMITILFVALLVIFFLLGFIAEVTENWPRYRCKPYVIPFADFFGYDNNENFNFCMKKVFESQTGETLSPIYQLLAQYSSSVGLMVNSVNGFRKLLGNFMTSTNVFIRNVRNKIQSLMFQVRLSFLKMQVLMNRVYGTMYSVVWMGNSAITAGLNLSDNDLVKFLFEFCFHPETKVRLSNGRVIKIRDVDVGNILEGGARVTSRFQFKGDRTAMVQIGPDVLSSYHMIQHPTTGKWLPALHHPEATAVASIPELICLNVEGHRFMTAAGLVVADYDESESTVAVQTAQAIAQKALNGGTHQGSSVSDYSLGLDGDVHIALTSGNWKPIKAVALGDHLYGGTEVLGIVEEECEDVRILDGDIRVAAAQLVFHEDRWQRAAHLTNSKETETLCLRHIVTDRAAPLRLRKGGKEIWVRDYREAPLPDMEAPYQAALRENKN